MTTLITTNVQGKTKSKWEEYLRERVGIDFPLLLPPQIAGFGGIWAAAALWSGGWRKSGEGGEEGGLRGPRYLPWRDKPLVAPVHVARQRRHVIVPVSAAVAHRSIELQRVTAVAPHALARQRPTVVPIAVARPNGLWRKNKMTTGLKLKYYFKKG